MSNDQIPGADVKDGTGRLGKKVNELEKRLRDEQDKRVEDKASTTRWGVNVAIGLGGILVLVLVAAIVYLAERQDSLSGEFHREAREIRDRVTVIETERRTYKELNLRDPSAHPKDGAP